jgi:hypothetical protein
VLKLRRRIRQRRILEQGAQLVEAGKLGVLVAQAAAERCGGGASFDRTGA